MLQDEGQELWFDQMLKPFQNWQEQLLKAISDSDYFIYMLSRSSALSAWCKWEYREAIRLGKPICPIRLEEFQLPDELSSLEKIQWLNCFEGTTVDCVARMMQGLSYLSSKLSIEDVSDIHNPLQTNEKPAQFRPYYSAYISHSSIDQEFVKPLYDFLTANGVHCFYAVRDLTVGENIFEYVAKSIHDADKMLICCSTNYFSSWWCNFDFDLIIAKEQKVFREGGTNSIIVPILLDDSLYYMSDNWKSTLLLSRYVADAQRWKSNDQINKAFSNILLSLEVS